MNLIPIELEPLLIWTFLAYLILLFFSFGIEEIQKNFRVEILFISGVIGTVFYFVFEYLIKPTISALFELWPIINETILRQYYATNPILLAVPQSFTASNFVFAGAVVILGTYYIALIAFLLITKTIKYCLDPKNEIFNKLTRFKLLDELNIEKIVIFGLPALIIIFWAIFFIISLGIQSCIVLFNQFNNYFKNPIFYHYFWIDAAFSLIIVLIGFILGICALFVLIQILYRIKKLFDPLKDFLLLKLQKIVIKWQKTVFFPTVEDNRFLIWIKNHHKKLLILFLILLSLIFFYDYIWPCNCSNIGCGCFA
jgi:hypothetical protein